MAKAVEDPQTTSTTTSPSLTLAKKPTVGVVTYDSEGTEGGKYHSRKLHVPTDSSGVTIGRGYDCKTKTESQIAIDLKAAGLSETDSKAVAKAAGLSGETARTFIKENKLTDFEVTQDQQVALFNKTYENEEKEAKRLCSKKDVESKFGTCGWDKLEQAIKEIVVDLKFRGDYTASVRKNIQESITGNDLEEFTKKLKDANNFPGVPSDRFKRRKEFLEEAVKQKKKENDAKKHISPPPS